MTGYSYGRKIWIAVVELSVVQLEDTPDDLYHRMKLNIDL